MFRLIFFAIFFWGIILINSHIGSEEFFLPSPKVEVCFLIFIVAIAIGGLSSEKASINGCSRAYCLVQASRLRLGILIYSVLLLLIAYKALILIIHGDYSRVALYSVAIGDRYPIIYVFLVYLKSFLSIFINFSFLYALLNDRKRLAVISLLLILADSFLFLSRGPLVSLLFIVLLAQFFSISKKTLNRSSSNKKNLIFLVILIIFIAAISFIRQDGFLSFIRDYLLIGPVIFSSLVSGLFDNSYCGPLNMPIVFSGIDYLVAIFLRGILHVDFHSIGYDWIKLIDEQVLTGSSGFEFIYHNAFYTILAEPFKAMGMSGVAALGWFFGYFLHKLSWAYRKFSCEYSLLLLSYLWVILLTGIFGNALASPILWLFLIAMPIVKRVIFTPVIIKAHK